MRKILALTALAAAAIAMTASPATASSSVSTFGCAWNADDAVFSSLATLGSTGFAARGDDPIREPTLDVTYETMPESAKGKGGPGFKATVPVWFHVVSPDGVTGNVTQEQIDEQIAVMNLGFGGFYGGANTGFKFKLAGVTRTVNAEWYFAGPTTSGERAMKKALRVGGFETLNYYSTTAGPYLGWAYLPGLNDAQAYLDGIVVDWESMVHTSTRYENRYDLGFTAVHEAGHWFNLLHTFDGGCNANGDYVDDTPAMKIPTSGCPADNTKDTCTRDPGFDPIHNFEDYSYDQCYTEFTAGQGARMQDAYLFFRAP